MGSVVHEIVVERIKDIWSIGMYGGQWQIDIVCRNNNNIIIEEKSS